MSNHLRPEEFVEALDGAIPPAAAAHLAKCGECQDQLAQMLALVSDVRGVPAPEPSPLFWDHFSARVTQATLAEPAPGAVAWWRGWWRPVGAIATAVGAVALVITLRPAASVEPVGAPAESAAVLDAPADDGSWGLVVGLASDLKWSEVHEAAEPAAGTADAMIEELTAAQRDAFVKLLQKEMGAL